MHDLWLKALAELKWKPGESDNEYKVRVAKPYEVFQRCAPARPRRASGGQGKGRHGRGVAAASKSPN